MNQGDFLCEEPEPLARECWSRLLAGLADAAPSAEAVGLITVFMPGFGPTVEGDGETEVFGVRWPSGVYIAAGLNYEDDGVFVWEPTMLPERQDDRWMACFYAEPRDPSLRPILACQLCTTPELLAFVHECEREATT